MAAKQKEEVVETSDDEADNFDNYGVFQSDYEFKFVQEGNDKTTLMLPPITYDSMEVKYFNVEIEVDSELLVSALERERTANGTTRFFFRIAKSSEQVGQGDDGEVYEKLGEDGYDYGGVKGKAPEKAQKQKGKKQKPKALMDAHNYSKPKVMVKSAPTVKVEAEESPKMALDGTQIVKDDDDEEYDNGGDMEDDGDDDDDMDDIEEIGVDTSVGDDDDEDDDDDDSMKTPKRKKMKQELTSTGKKRRKYDKSRYYSKESDNFSVEMSEEGNKVFKCNTCNYISKWPGNMRDHVRVHTGERPFACDQCDKRFANQSGLQKHSVIHSEERPHSCDICGFAFKLKRQLVKHYRRHLTPGSILCPICGKRYYSQSELRHHMPTHTGERKHECNICHKMFMSISSLGRHKGLHSGARFECHICGNLSMRKEYWRTHMIKVHLFDPNDEMLAKRGRFPRLYEQTEEMRVPSVHTIRVVKAENVEVEEGEIIQGEQIAQVEEIDPGQEINDENVQYIISLDY